MFLLVYECTQVTLAHERVFSFDWQTADFAPINSLQLSNKPKGLVLFIGKRMSEIMRSERRK